MPRSSLKHFGSNAVAIKILEEIAEVDHVSLNMSGELVSVTLVGEGGYRIRITALDVGDGVGTSPRLVVEEIER